MLINHVCKTFTKNNMETKLLVPPVNFAEFSESPVKMQLMTIAYSYPIEKVFREKIQKVEQNISPNFCRKSINHPNYLATFNSRKLETLHH